MGKNVLVGLPDWLHTFVVVEKPIDCLYFPRKNVGWNQLEADQTQKTGSDRQTIRTLGVNPADYRQKHIQLISTQLRTP